MPTNLPPDYFEIEKRFRQAQTVEEKIELLQEMYSVVPKHKGTDHLRADLRRRLAKLNAEAQSQKRSGKRDSAFHIPRAGAGQAVLVGLANTGKSTLLQALTAATAEASPAPYSTWEPTPGMMPFENIQVQLVDTPSLSREYVEPRLKELLRRADLLLLVVDLQQAPDEQLRETAELLEEYRIAPQHRRAQVPDDPRWSFLPMLVLVNKCDSEADEELFQIFCELAPSDWTCLPVSATTGRNLEQLKQRIVAGLGILRIYTKVPGKPPDFSAPFVMKPGSTLEDVAAKIHKDFVRNLKYARVWGSAVHDGQMVQRDYLLHDGDIVELHV